MNASDVYNIAKALSQEEFELLYNMLKKDLHMASSLKGGRKKLPDFTLEDGIRYLIKHHMKGV